MMSYWDSMQLMPGKGTGAPARTSTPIAQISTPNWRSTKTLDRHQMRRATSEKALEEALDWNWEPGAAYHVISGGDIDALSFLKMALRQQPLDYLAFSTWCMAVADIAELERYMALGRIGRVDSYVGEIFKGSYASEYSRLVALHKAHGGRVCIFRNHSKVFVGFGPAFAFVVETSANINTNPRAENFVITINADLARFYKGYFDGITSFERNFDDWKPFALEGQW